MVAQGCSPNTWEVEAKLEHIADLKLAPPHQQQKNLSGQLNKTPKEENNMNT